MYLIKYMGFLFCILGFRRTWNLIYNWKVVEPGHEPRRVCRQRAGGGPSAENPV